MSSPELFRSDAVKHASASHYGRIMLAQPAGHLALVALFALSAALLLLFIGFSSYSENISVTGALINTVEPTPIRAPAGGVLAASHGSDGTKSVVGQILFEIIADGSDPAANTADAAQNSEPDIGQVGVKLTLPSIATGLQPRVEDGKSSNSAPSPETNGVVQRLELRASADGMLTEVAVRTGQRVKRGQTLATLVPEMSRLEAEVLVPAHPGATLRTGMRAQVRVQSYPTARPAIIAGEIREITRLSLEVDEKLSKVAGVSPELSRSPLYRVRISLDRQTLVVDGVEFVLAAGDLIEANIPLRERRLLHWIIPQSTVTEKSSP